MKFIGKESYSNQKERVSEEGLEMGKYQQELSLRDTSVQNKNIVINQQKQGNPYFPGPNIGPCNFDKRHSFWNVVGNVFVLGLIVIINEILDLAASQSLNFLLEPCLSGNVAAEEEVADDALVDNIDSFIGL